jgi:hypothetical protein
MVRKAHFEILRFGVDMWNSWRQKNPATKVDLVEEILVNYDLSGVNFKEANLRGANLRRTNLTYADISQAKLSQANLNQADLSGANLNSANLYRADLRQINLTGANLVGANLMGASLNEAVLKNADITGIKLWGSARDNWNIDGIQCDYVFWDLEGNNQVPENRNFMPGEFEELYKDLPTIEYIFKHGFTPLDAFVMDKVVEAINERHPPFELKLDSFHSRGQPHAVFTVLHRDVAEEALNQIKSEYDVRIAKLEGERDALESCFNRAIEEPRTIIKRIEMGDKYNIKGQTGAVGPGAQAHDINFNQVWNQVSSDIDLKQLEGDLSQLRQAMKKEAETLEHDTAVGEIAAAEVAAQANKGPKALEHLKKAGKWAFSVAENIGTTIAAEALKKAMGL